MTKKLNDKTYNSVIDQCNESDQEVANFFQAVVRGDLEELKRILMINPTIAYEVND